MFRFEWLELCVLCTGLSRSGFNGHNSAFYVVDYRVAFLTAAYIVLCRGLSCEVSTITTVCSM